MEEGQGLFVELEDLFLEFQRLGREFPLFRQGNVIALGQKFQSFGKAEVFLFHDQGKNVAAHAASETMIELFVGIDREGG